MDGNSAVASASGARAETSSPFVLIAPRTRREDRSRGREDRSRRFGAAIADDMRLTSAISSANAASDAKRSGDACYRKPARQSSTVDGKAARLAVDGEGVTPQSGGFYSGWITSDLIGPFKGENGSRFW